MWFGDASHLDVSHCSTFLVRGTLCAYLPMRTAEGNADIVTRKNFRVRMSESRGSPA